MSSEGREAEGCASLGSDPGVTYADAATQVPVGLTYAAPAPDRAPVEPAGEAATDFGRCHVVVIIQIRHCHVLIRRDGSSLSLSLIPRDSPALALYPCISGQLDR